MRRRVVIVGGGVSGLATAWFLSRSEDPPDSIAVLEASARWGGILRTERRDGFLFEGGPDSFVAQKPQAIELCRQLGLGGTLVESPPAGRGAWVWRNGAMHRFPSGILMRAPIPLGPLLESPLLSPGGRRRLLEEPTVAASDREDESVAEFFGRRLGREVLENFAEPLVAGVFGGEAERLGVRSTFRALFELERRRGFVTEPDGAGEAAAGSPFLTLGGGVESLIEALVADLEGRAELRLGAPVHRLRRLDGGYFVEEEGGDSWRADAVVLAVPPPVAAGLAGDWPPLAEALRGIAAPPAIVACLGYPEDVTAGRSGSGFLVPRAEAKTILACTWVHRKFPGRAPEGCGLLRCFVGNRRASRLLSAPDREILDLIGGDLSDLMGIGRAPSVSAVYRWPHGLPQYGLSHHLRAAAIVEETSRGRGLFCVGNFLDGVGVSDCVRHARVAAGRIGREWADD